MKRVINISVLLLALAVTMTSCFKNEEDDIFDKSAADRLEDAIKDYSDILTSQGGKWAMEYFASAEEPGYVYVMDFKKDGSVLITGANKWVAMETGTYDAKKLTFDAHSERSMWEVIADNGPVLTFNTYNHLFHLFANPEDVPGTDEDENGYGHDGDYEFDLMRTNAAGDTLFLEGKKHGMNIIMYRLPQETVNDEYFAAINRMIEITHITTFPDLVLHGADGNDYIVNDIATQIPTFYPKDVDWRFKPARTVSGNAIATIKGFRFVNPLSLINNNDGSTLTVQHFEMQEDGSFLCTDDGISRITSLPVGDVFIDVRYAWRFDPEDLGGEFATRYQEVVDACYNKFGHREFQFFRFKYDEDEESMMLNFLNGTLYGNFGIIETMSADGVLTIEFTEYQDNNARNHIRRCTPAFENFNELLDGHSFRLFSGSAMNPSRIKLVDTANENNYFWVNVDVEED